MTGRRRLASVPDTPRLAVISLRVSRTMGRDKYGDSFHAPDLQEDACRRFCAERGWHVVQVVTDLDVSGGVFDRPGLNEAMTMLEQGQATALVTYDVSRLGRKVKETLEVIDRVRETGAVYASVKERFDDTPEGEHLLHTFLSIAHLYRRQRGRGWQEVIERRAEQGRFHGSIPPYGYQLRDGGLHPDPLAAPLIRRAFERYAAGDRAAHVAREVTEQRGRLMALTTLKATLRNPVYVGRIRVNGQTYDGIHTPIVDERTWEAVAKRLERDVRTPSRHLAMSHPLVGLVVCDLCGYRLQMHPEKARPGKGTVDVDRLQCNRRIEGGARVCAGPGTPDARQVEAAVLEQIPLRLQELLDDAGQRQAKQSRRTRAGVDADRLRRELRDTTAAIATLAVDRARRQISQQAYDLAVERLEDEAAGLQRQLDVTEQVADSLPLRATVAAAWGLLALWPVMTNEERNRDLRLLLREVRVRRSASYREPLSAAPGGRVFIDWL